MISVLYSPLFEAVYSDGRVEQLGLMDLLSKAHLITDIKANSCTGKLALIRFCMAFLSDAYLLDNLGERADLLEIGAFDTARLRDYVGQCEAAGVSFDLDDEKHPFMQAAYDAELDAKSEKPVSNILFDCPSGNNHIHLDHRYEDAHEIDTRMAFEAMLETYMFCPAGLSGASNVNSALPLYAIVYGKNLFETLVLNMVSAEEIGNIPYGGGEVAWRRNHCVAPGEKCAEMSLLKALTWQPRRLTLHWDEDGKVRSIHLQKGLDFKGNGLWLDPHIIYTQKKDGVWSPVDAILGRELWRDAGTLLAGEQRIKRTIPIQNIDSMLDNMPSVSDLDIEMVCLIGEKGREVILGRNSERLRLPMQLFEKDHLAWEFRTALNLVETMNRALENQVKEEFCHKKDKKNKKKEKSMIAQQASEVFLYEMHHAIFGHYLDELIVDGSFQQRSRWFLDEMWRVLDQAVLADVVEQTGTDVASLKRQNSVRGGVRREYNKLRKGVEGN